MARSRNLPHRSRPSQRCQPMLLSHSSSLPASSGTAAVNGLTTLVHTQYRSCHRPTVAFTPSLVGRSWGPAQHAAPAFAFAASGHWGQITANEDGNITLNSCKSTHWHQLCPWEVPAEGCPVSPRQLRDHTRITCCCYLTQCYETRLCSAPQGGRWGEHSLRRSAAVLHL